VLEVNMSNLMQKNPCKGAKEDVVHSPVFRV
jgi:hypothetical protein